jgi:DprA/Smf-like nucleotide binding protein involved in DNA uptake
MVLGAEKAEKEEFKTASPGDSWRQHQARILDALKAAQEPLAIDDLAREVGLGFLQLSELVLDLVRRNEIVVLGPPGKEVLTLGSASTR